MKRIARRPRRLAEPEDDEEKQVRFAVTMLLTVLVCAGVAFGAWRHRFHEPRHRSYRATIPYETPGTSWEPSGPASDGGGYDGGD